MVDGRHYTTYIDEVKSLRRAGDLDAAAGVLLRLVSAVEREAAIPLAGHGAPRWYHEQLASIYAKVGAMRQADAVKARLGTMVARAEAEGQAALDELRNASASPAAPKPRPLGYFIGRAIARLFRRQ